MKGIIKSNTKNNRIVTLTNGTDIPFRGGKLRKRWS